MSGDDRVEEEEARPSAESAREVAVEEEEKEVSTLGVPARFSISSGNLHLTIPDAGLKGLAGAYASANRHTHAHAYKHTHTHTLLGALGAGRGLRRRRGLGKQKKNNNNEKKKKSQKNVSLPARSHV